MIFLFLVKAYQWVKHLLYRRLQLKTIKTSFKLDNNFNKLINSMFAYRGAKSFELKKT